MRILLVEDDRDLRRFMTIALEGFEHRVFSFPDVDLLFAEGRWRNIDALVLDLVLKRGQHSALELLLWMDAKKIPVRKVVVTGWDILRTYDDVTYRLADAVLSKPVDIHKLNEVLHGRENAEEDPE